VIRRVCGGFSPVKPEIVIPVFDTELLPLAKKVADGLTNAA